MSGQEVQVQDLLRTLSSLTRRVYHGINSAATECKDFTIYTVCQYCFAIITNLTSTLISELELLVDRAKNGDRLDSALLPGTDTSKDFAKHKVLCRIYTYLD